jgi:branched-chain amino acid transport system substrate-binding protein
MAIDAALTTTGGDSANRDALIAAIKGVKLITPAGPFEFDDINNPIQPRYIMQIRARGDVVEPVVLGKIDKFLPRTAPPTLPAGLVLPRK